jgi:microcystin-dependent protein
MALTQIETTNAREITFKVVATGTGSVITMRVKKSNQGSFTNYNYTIQSTDTRKSVVDGLLAALPEDIKVSRSQNADFNNTEHSVFTLYITLDGVDLIATRSGSSNLDIESFVPVGFSWTDDPLNRVEPDSSKKILGFELSERMKRQFVNYMFNMVGHCTKAMAGMSNFVRDGIKNTQGVVIGEIKAYAGSDIPYGFSKCDGETLPNTAQYQAYRAWVELNAPYLKLTPDGYDAIFLTPSLAQKSLIGSGVANLPSETVTYNVGQYGGSAVHRLTESELPSHTHTIPSLDGGKVATGMGDGQALNAKNVSGMKTEATGGNGFHNNMPPYMVANFIIRTYY